MGFRSGIIYILNREELGLGEIIGMMAGALTTCAFLPQVFKTIKTRSTGDLS